MGPVQGLHHRQYFSLAISHKLINRHASINEEKKRRGEKEKKKKKKKKTTNRSEANSMNK